MPRNFEVYYKGEPYESLTALAKAFGISTTAVKNRATLTEDRVVVLRDGIEDLRDTLRTVFPKGINFDEFVYDGRSFENYHELSSYVGIPLVALRHRDFTNESFASYVTTYRETEYPILVHDVRYPSLSVLATTFDLPKNTFHGLRASDREGIEKRLKDAILSKNAREATKMMEADRKKILYKGEYYTDLAEISLKFNLDIRELMTASRCGEPLENVTKAGRWGILTENGLDLTPRKFYEYQAEHARLNK